MKSGLVRKRPVRKVAAGFAQQGAWMKQKSVKPRSLSWPDLWSMDLLMIKFLIRSTSNVLPSLVNMKIWNCIQNDSWHRWYEKETSEHILSGFPVSSSWKHDQVLEGIASALKPIIKHDNESLVPVPPVKFIPFVKGGQVLLSGVNR